MLKLSPSATTGAAPAIQKAVDWCRRLHSALTARRLAERLRSLDRQIEVLRDQMAIDDQLAENNRRLYLKSPVLQSRREEDRRYMAQLQAHRELLANQLEVPR